MGFSKEMLIVQRKLRGCLVCEWGLCKEVLVFLVLGMGKCGVEWGLMVMRVWCGGV